MIMGDKDKQRLASIIIARRKPAGSSLDDMKAANQEAFESQAGAEGAEEMPEGLKQAAQEMMDAFDSKNPVALAEAMKSFVSMCGDEDDYGPEAQSDEE